MGNMTVCFDGLRSNATNDLRKLKSIVKSIIDNDFHDNEDLKDAMNQVICNNNVLLCVFYPEEQNFSDLSESCLDQIGDES